MYPQIRQLLETCLLTVASKKKKRLALIEVSTDTDGVFMKKVQREQKGMVFSGVNPGTHVLGVLTTPWDSRKRRTERPVRIKNVIVPTPEGNREINYKEAAVLGLRQPHSDSEGAINILIYFA